MEKPSITFCFGPFELRARSREVYKHGIKLKLRPQPFQILTELLRKSGELVTREELREKLWSPETFVDFEQSLNTSVKELRAALGDSAAEPKYVETVPRIGYRFIGKVVETRVGSSAQEVLHDTAGPVTSVRIEAKRTKWTWIAAAGVALLLVGLAMWLFLPVPPPKVTGSVQLTADSNPCCPMVTDGVRLYFRENRPDGPELAQVSVMGGDISLLPVPISHPVIADISPDHSQLLITTYDSPKAPFWGLPLPSGSPRRIGDIEGGWASWAPDSKHLLFARDFNIYLAAENGNDVRKVVSGAEGNPEQLRVSPDGSRIRFTVNNRRAHTQTLWEVRVDGSGLHRLLPGWGSPPNECCGQWTPDGRYYVFESDAGGGAHDIFALRESRVRGFFSKSSNSPIRLTFGPLKFEAPAVSLDEKKLFVFGWHQRGELVRYDGGAKQFVPFLGGLSATDVAFSQDGKWFAYVSIPSYNLWRSRVDGSDRVQLTPSDGSISALPRWSPDGKQIAFMARVGGKAWTIFLIAADGGSPRPLLPAGIAGSDATWSADGTQLAFGTGFTSSTPKSDIEIFNVETQAISAVPGSSGMFSPRWSPDGRYLAALSFEYPAKKVFLYNFRTQKWSDWISDQDIGYPSWTQDSRYLQYLEYNGGDNDPRVRRVKVGDSRPENIFTLKGLRRYPGNAGFWSDATPDGSRMFVRDASGRDIYALDVDFP
ncbi:MAG: winged helix-turn-helix domain-containing protein [Candidatus Acidiferrum sp.]